MKEVYDSNFRGDVLYNVAETGKYNFKNQRKLFKAVLYGASECLQCIAELLYLPCKV